MVAVFMQNGGENHIFGEIDTSKTTFMPNFQNFKGGFFRDMIDKFTIQDHFISNRWPQVVQPFYGLYSA